MPPLPRPHRVTFLPPIVTFAHDETRQHILIELLQQVVFGHLVDHPVVSITDPAERSFIDGTGFLIDANHPDVGELVAWEHTTARRDEVLWLELTLVPGATGMPRLHCRGADGTASVYSEGGGSLSGGLGGALLVWLDERGLPSYISLPSFTSDELRQVAVWAEGLAAQATDPDAPATILTTPPVPSLCAAGLRTVTRLIPPDPDFAREIDELILEVLPDDLIANRNRLARRIAAGTAARGAARELCAAAPQWSKAHLFAAIQAASADAVDEALRHAAAASVLAPESPEVAETLADLLVRAGRPDEAYRAAARAVRLAPDAAGGRLAAVRALRAAGRRGDALYEADAACTTLAAAGGGEGDQLIRAHHALAATHVEVGRLADGISLARRALAETPDGALPELRAELDAWESDPLILAAAYARDGAYRREPGRVVEGFGRGRPLDAHDAALLVDAEIALGRDELATFIHVREAAARRAEVPAAWIAGARAALLAGDLDRAATLTARVTLRAGAARVDGPLLRLLRLYPIQPAAEWEALIAARLDAGAPTLARLLARDVADFVPGLERSEIVARALGPRGRPMDDGILAPLRAALPADVDLAGGTQLFAAHREPRVADADYLVGHWLDALETAEGDVPRAAQLVWIFAGALSRYFAATRVAPSPLAGGLRVVASEALALLERHVDAVPTGTVRALLEVLDAAILGVDPWVLDRWLLRLERALDVEGRTGGHLASFTANLPRVAEHLRGPERIAFELRLAVDLKDDGDPTNDDEARVLYERSLRAVGTAAVAAGWSEVSSGLAAALALDVHHTAAVVAPDHAGPHLGLARGLFATGRAEAGFESLLAGLPLLGPTAREQRIAEMAPLVAHAELTPIDWLEAQDRGLAHLEAGRAVEASRCFRWCNAIDPGNGGMLKNAGLALAALGRAADTCRVFAEMDPAGALELAGHALLQAGHRPAALRVLRAAASGSPSATDWVKLGRAAFYAEDDEAAAEAFERAHALRRALGARLASEELAAFADALAGAGRWERCQHIAEELLEAAPDGPLRARAEHAMARSLLGQGRVVEAVPYAQRALAADPLGENAAAVAETLARATRDEPYPPRTQRLAEPGPRAFAALAAGDPGAAASIAASASDWAAARAGLAAAAVRVDESPVGEDALRIIAANLDASAGAVDREPALWRVQALALREEAYFPADTPPPLGERMSREELDRQLADLIEEDEPTIMRELPPRRATAAVMAMSEDDLLVFPGTQIPRLSDYVSVMKAMRGADPLGTLARLGLDMAGYAQLATRWGQRLAADPDLSARFTAKMTE